MSNRLTMRTDRFNMTERVDLDIMELPDNDVSIELEIRFYTVAKYVGLIGSENIDNFSETAHPILVNQDKQEDLVNSCSLFDLIKDCQTVRSVYFRQPLFKPVKKSQIIKAIPTVFRHEHHNKHSDSPSDCDFTPEGEHRVFVFNDI